jgi:hypothetical protein
MIPYVTATGFHRFLQTGRTNPAIFYCESTSDEVTDYVVKLRGGMERRSGPVCELYAAMLAKHLGLFSPSPAMILIQEDLALAIADIETDPRRAAIIRDSIGLNYGCEFLPNVVTWPEGQSIPGALVEEGMKVYGFDALIQNPDRGFDNPNLGTYQNKIVVFDHELAFSFLLEIFPSREPWKLAEERYLDDHVFANQLKEEMFPEDFTQRLSALTADVLQMFASVFPPEWQLDDLPKIEAHLGLMQEHAAEFAEEVLRRLA